MTKGLNIILSLFLSLGILLATLTTVNAVNVNVQGNGAGSNNQVNYNQSNQTNYNQNNQANINNNVDANCNTGGNSASGNTGGNSSINTGNCKVNVNVQNQVNSNQIGGVISKPKVSPSPSAGNPSASDPTSAGSSSDSGSSSSGSSSSPQVLAGTGTASNQLIALLGAGLIFSGLWLLRPAIRTIKA